MIKRARLAGAGAGLAGAGAGLRDTKEIVLDPITMLLWKLLAVFHDPIHDFGLNIERMSSIVLYINHMVDELRIRVTPIVPQQGGFITGSVLEAAIERKKKEALKLRSFDGRQARNVGNVRKVYRAREYTEREYTDREETEREYTDREETIERNAIKQIVIVEPPEEDINDQYQQILYYNRCVVILNNSDHQNSGKMLELFVHMNQLIEQIKLFVVFQIFDDIGDDAGQHPDITRDRIISSINVLYNLIQGINVVVGDFQITKNVILVILQMMNHIYIQLSKIRINEAIEHPGQIYLYLDLFKGPLLHDILRVLLLNYFRAGRNVNDEEHIARIVTKILTSTGRQGGGARRGTVKRGTTKRGSVRHHYKMYGGSMVLSAFRAIDAESRTLLENTLLEWETSVIYRGPLPPSPPDQMAEIVERYMAFFQRVILPPINGNRQLDPRLIRKLNIVTFGRLKNTIPLLYRKYQVVPIFGTELARMTRGALTNYGAELVKKMNEFMDQTKTDFEGLIAEEVAAVQADAAAAAAAPVPRTHRIAVQQVSKLIAKKGLEYARVILTGLLVVPGQQQQPVAMLPQLQIFLPIAIQYIGSILQQPGAGQVHALAPLAPLQPAAAIGGVLAPQPKEYDKYNNLLVELYLLGLICRYDGNGGLPDIDTRLFDYYRGRYLVPAGVNGVLPQYAGLVFCNDQKAQQIFQRVRTNSGLFRVINNSVSRAVKDLIDGSTVCPSSSKCDAMGSFGGCASDHRRNEFCSMRVVLRDNANVSNYMALTEVTEERGNFFVKVVNQFNLGRLVVNSTHSRVDLQTNPTLLSANNVFKKALDTIVNLWKSDPNITPDALWALLDDDDNFKRLMDSISQKGIGDIYQELNSIIAEAGYVGSIPLRILAALAKITVGLAGDRPSAIRMMILLMYAQPVNLMKNGRVIVGYGNDTNSFLVGHPDHIPLQPAAAAIRKRQGGSLRSRVRSIKNKIYKKRHNKTKKRS